MTASLDDIVEPLTLEERVAEIEDMLVNWTSAISVLQSLAKTHDDVLTAHSQDIESVKDLFEGMVSSFQEGQD